MNHVNIHCAFFFPQLYLIDVMMGKRANLDPRNKSEMFHTECFYSKGVRARSLRCSLCLACHVLLLSYHHCSVSLSDSLKCFFFFGISGTRFRVIFKS